MLCQAPFVGVGAPSDGLPWALDRLPTQSSPPRGRPGVLLAGAYLGFLVFCGDKHPQQEAALGRGRDVECILAVDGHACGICASRQQPRDGLVVVLHGGTHQRRLRLSRPSQCAGALGCSLPFSRMALGLTWPMSFCAEGFALALSR